MKSTLKITIMIMFGVTLFISGCVGTPVSIKSFPAKDIVLTSGRPISAEACGFQLLLFIPIKINSRLERAFEELNLKTANESIANLSIEEDWTYGFVGTMYCTKLSAIAYQKAANK